MTTRYEVQATKEGVSYAIGYTPRVSRIGLLKLMQSFGAEIIKACEITNQHEMVFATKPRVHATVNGWVIGFTGRTQREAHNSPPVPYIPHA